MRRSSYSPERRVDFLFRESITQRATRRSPQRPDSPTHPSRSESTRNPFVLLTEIQQLLLTNRQAKLRFSSECLNKIFRIFANEDFEWEDLGETISEQLLSHIYSYRKEFSLEDITFLTWSLARLGANLNQILYFDYEENKNVTLLDELLSIISRNTAKFDTKQCVNLMWAFVALDIDFEKIRNICMTLIMRIRIMIEKDPDLSHADDKHLLPLKDFIAFYFYQFPERVHVMLNEISLIVDRQVMLATKPPASSFTHLQIASLIRKHCENAFANEVLIAGSHADICFVNEKVVIEIDGPYHFNLRDQLNVHTRTRQRVMEKCGYTVFRIDCRAWSRLNAVEKIDFIRELLFAANLQLREMHPQPTIRVEITLEQFLPPLLELPGDKATPAPQPSEQAAPSYPVPFFPIPSKKRKVAEASLTIDPADMQKTKSSRK
jgi:very-short-patch-repair endonuclease